MAGLHAGRPGQEGVDDVEGGQDAVGGLLDLLRVLGVGDHPVGGVDLHGQPLVPGIGGQAAVQRVELGGVGPVEGGPGSSQVKEERPRVGHDVVAVVKVYQGRERGGWGVAGGAGIDLSQGPGLQGGVDPRGTVGSGELPVAVLTPAVGP